MTGIEPLLQVLRIRQAMPYLKPGLVLVDLGCDFEMTLIKQVRSKMKKVIGVDAVVPAQKTGNLEIIKADITQALPITTSTADVVTMLAVLEHLPNPEFVLQQVYKILKPGGVLVVTVPSRYSKWLLEKVMMPLGLVRREMIEQHQNYFTPEFLRRLAKQARLEVVKAHYFELGFNTLLIARKPV